MQGFDKTVLLITEMCSFRGEERVWVSRKLKRVELRGKIIPNCIVNIRGKVCINYIFGFNCFHILMFFLFSYMTDFFFNKQCHYYAGFVP